MIKNKKLLFIFSILLITSAVLYMYIEYYLSPGDLDFLLRSRTYNKIAQIISSPEYNDIDGVNPSNEIYYNNRTYCSKNGDEASMKCDSADEIILHLFNRTNIVKYMKFDNSYVFFHSGIGGLNNGNAYVYSKKGFTKNDLLKFKVKKIIDSHWVVIYFGY